jgi:YHS domain-containing protein
MKATDVVCGKSVDAVVAQKDHRTSEHKSEVFYFCSQNCKRIFEASPALFLVPEKMLPDAQDTPQMVDQFVHGPH